AWPGTVVAVPCWDNSLTLCKAGEGLNRKTMMPTQLYGRAKGPTLGTMVGPPVNLNDHKELAAAAALLQAIEPERVNLPPCWGSEEQTDTDK
ncbi:Uncharacterized protein DAT39_005545, partial [Clarias magur]